MTFGEYVRARRKSLQLRQSDLKGFSQAYVSDIENGNNNPTLRETIETLANELKLPKDRVDWLQAYALFDKDPDEYFGKPRTANGLYINEKGHYYNHADPELCVGASPEDVLRILGEPTKRVRFGVNSYWLYSDFGLRVIFSKEQVASLESV